MKHPNALLIFAKNPVRGTVKTRLAATIGADAALVVYQELLTYTQSATQLVPADKIVYYAEQIPTDDFWGNAYEKAIQTGEDLGERMNHAFKETFQKGYGSIVIIGTDCPLLTKEIIEEAFESLTSHEVVIGPAHDGGYYLLGMKKLHPALFRSIPWSTPAVFEATIAICQRCNLSRYLLPTLPDVDEEKDLVHLKKANA